MSIPILDLSFAETSDRRPELLAQLHDALFNVGFLYIKNHGIPQSTISSLTSLLPSLFNLSPESKEKLSKLNSPHFLGYNGFAEETTLGQKDLREQLDFATELPVIWGLQSSGKRDFSKSFWRLRGPNQWPDEQELPGFKGGFIKLVIPNITFPPYLD
jgi:isopenicillin N synthase-like dioxygenase